MLAPATPRPGLSRAARKIGRDPLGFAMQTIRAFRANQGLLLAGGVAYYTLLSIVPLMILLVIILSHVIDAEELMSTLARYLGNRGSRPVGPADRRIAGVHRAPRSDRLDARGHADLLQLARVLGARKRDVGDLLPPRAREAPAVRGVGADTVPLHPVSRDRPPGRNTRGWRAAGAGTEQRSTCSDTTGRFPASRARCST